MTLGRQRHAGMTDRKGTPPGCDTWGRPEGYGGEQAESQSSWLRVCYRRLRVLISTAGRDALAPIS